MNLTSEEIIHSHVANVREDAMNYIECLSAMDSDQFSNVVLRLLMTYGTNPQTKLDTQVDHVLQAEFGIFVTMMLSIHRGRCYNELQEHGHEIDIDLMTQCNENFDGVTRSAMYEFSMNTDRLRLSNPDYREYLELYRRII